MEPGSISVRELQRKLEKRGLSLASEADESSTGPASYMIIDPDGNPILIGAPKWNCSCNAMRH